MHVSDDHELPHHPPSTPRQLSRRCVDQLLCQAYSSGRCRCCVTTPVTSLSTLYASIPLPLDRSRPLATLSNFPIGRQSEKSLFPVAALSIRQEFDFGILDTDSSISVTASMQPCTFTPTVFRHSFALPAFCTPFLRSYSVNYIMSLCSSMKDSAKADTLGKHPRNIPCHPTSPAVCHPLPRQLQSAPTRSDSYPEPVDLENVTLLILFCRRPIDYFHVLCDARKCHVLE